MIASHQLALALPDPIDAGGLYETVPPDATAQTGDLDCQIEIVGTKTAYELLNQPFVLGNQPSLDPPLGRPSEDIEWRSSQTSHGRKSGEKRT